MKVLMIKNVYYKDRYDIKDKLKALGYYGKKYPKNLEQVPVDFREMFEMVEPELFAL